ncbi:VanZ family protein [Streptomyces sp. NPDC051020]|uniref:VanZ family protein n=1 Tax=Streptomyces sp. NPDC051020 TaxID=3155409 RepID=UPI0034327D22
MIIKGWHGWVGTFTGVALITVAVLPLAALTVGVLARRRRGTGITPAWAMSLAEVGIVYGTVPWVWMIMLPGGRAGTVPARVSLVPLRDLLTTLAGDPLTATVQVVGNLLVFAALGFFAPLRFAALASVPRILALAAGCSVLVETAQYVLRLDRVSSVDDVLLNAAGAGLAALVSRRWWRATARASSDRPRSAPVPGSTTPLTEPEPCTETLGGEDPGCAECGSQDLRAATGRSRQYCSRACQQRAYRARTTA